VDVAAKLFEHLGQGLLSGIEGENFVVPIVFEFEAVESKYEAQQRNENEGEEEGLFRVVHYSQKSEYER
jgi:hypothetical protein